jgi:hypothetical protein
MNKDEQSKLKLIDDLTRILDLAKEAFNNSNFVFNSGTFYGGIWKDVFEYMTSDSTVKDTITNKLFKVFIPFQAVEALRGTVAYFDQASNDAWYEKVRNLFSARNEEAFDSACYEFYIGAQLTMNERKIFFCNMDSAGQGRQESRCEYFIEPRLFIECKNLFGVGKTTLNNNIRNANSQLRESIRQITVNKPIGVVCLDLSDKIDIGNEEVVEGKASEAIDRLRQCDSTHFLVLTFMNVVNEPSVSTMFSESKLIINPRFISLIDEDPDCLSLFIPRFRFVFIPKENSNLFDVFDIVKGRIIAQNFSFSKLFGIES